MVVLVGCLVHFLVNGTQVWMICNFKARNRCKRKEGRLLEYENQRRKMFLSQVVLAILVTSFGTPHTVARRLHPDIFTSTGGDKYTYTHTLKDTHRHTR